MKNLLYKEFQLGIPKGIYAFALLSALLLIPAYPYIVGMGYVILAIFNTFAAAAANRDHEFTASLPVRRADIVLSKTAALLVLEGITLLAAVPFALLSSYAVNPAGNIVGMDANFAFFGFTFAEYGVFNAVFLPRYFRTGYKAGMPTLLGLIGYTLTGLVLELATQFAPALRVLDSLDGATSGYRLIALFAGMAAFALCTLFACRRAVKNFENVNL